MLKSPQPQEIQVWPIDKFVFYAHNPRKNDAVVTLAAAELAERVCYGLELDPKYVDVVVVRWQQLAGKQATLDVTVERSRRSHQSGRRRRPESLGAAKIMEIKAQLMAGHPDVARLCRALSDWSAELKSLEERGWYE